MAQTDKLTNKHTDGHRDSMTESAKWADSVKTVDPQCFHFFNVGLGQNKGLI